MKSKKYNTKGVVNPNAFYTMKQKTNRLTRYKAKQEIALHDLARIINISTSTLSRVERGLQEPRTRLFLLYHILFDEISIPSYFKEQYADWITEIIQRTHELMKELADEQTPKSDFRLSYCKHIVNRLKELKYEASK